MNSSLSQETARIALPFDDAFQVNVNTSQGFLVSDVYHVDFEGEPLAAGGFGTVYRGCHLFVTDMPAAIKKIDLRIQRSRQAQDQDSSSAQNRLIMGIEEQVAEIVILREFRDSHHIVHLHEYFVQASETNSSITSLFIVTELLQGGELFHCIASRNKEGKPFMEKDAREIFHILLKALQFMKSKRVMHRDLKPSNILLQLWDEPGSLKIADFGQSKMLRNDQDRANTCTGTPGYRPPEMYLRQEYNELCDMFSAGVILFFMVSGYQPFSSYPKDRIEIKTIQCEYRQDTESWKRVSAPVKRLVRRLLTRAEERLTVDQAANHEWMLVERGADRDLSENAKAIARSLEAERKLRKELRVSRTRIPADSLDNSALEAIRLPQIVSSSDENQENVIDRCQIMGTADGLLENVASQRIPLPVDASESTEHKHVHTITTVSQHTAEPPMTTITSKNADDGIICCSWVFRPFLRSHIPTTNPPQDDDELDDRALSSLRSDSISDTGLQLQARATSDMAYPSNSLNDNRIQSPSVRDDTHQSETNLLPQTDLQSTSSGDGTLPPLSTHSSSNRTASVRFADPNTPLSPSTRSQSSASTSAQTNQSSLTFWDPLFLHVGSDLPRGSRPLLIHISETYKEDDYTEQVARRYCKLIVECVAGLHESSVVHRKISMSTLLLHTDEEGRERIILRNTKYTTNTVQGEQSLTGYCGTPYLSTAPEVYTDFCYDEKVDLWSVGCVAYLLCVGIDPFHGLCKESIEAKRLSGYIDYPFSLDAPSKAARAFVQLLLQAEPLQRPSARVALQHEWMSTDEADLLEVNLEFAYGGLLDWQNRATIGVS